MNFDKLYTWAIGVVLAFATVGKLDTLQMWIWRAQAHVIHESRTSTWGSPRFFPDKKFVIDNQTKGGHTKNQSKH
jgi:hypothetical protein